MMSCGIAGGGLLGRLLAFVLARSGCRVDVFDPAAGPSVRGAAGWTAAGMLSPVAELECADADVFALGVRSIELWPAIVEALVPHGAVHLACAGSLLLAHRPDRGAAERVVSLLRAKAAPEHHPVAVTAAELAELEPAVHGPAYAWWLPREAQIHTVQAMSALAQAGAAHGAHFHWGQAVERVEAHTLLAGSGTHRFDHVFDVRGVGARPQWPVRGVRGEIVWLHAPSVRLSRPLRLLHPRHRVYLVPRPDDLVVVGASEIESEDRSPVSLRSVVELLAAAHSVVPELAEARIVHMETNLRPALPDNLPRWETEAGITRINGLFRHGWLIAPALIERACAPLGVAVDRAGATHAAAAIPVARVSQGLAR